MNLFMVLFFFAAGSACLDTLGTTRRTFDTSSMLLKRRAPVTKANKVSSNAATPARIALHRGQVQQATSSKIGHGLSFRDTSTKADGRISPGSKQVKTNKRQDVCVTGKLNRRGQCLGKPNDVRTSAQISSNPASRVTSSSQQDPSNSGRRNSNTGQSTPLSSGQQGSSPSSTEHIQRSSSDSSFGFPANRPAFPQAMYNKNSVFHNGDYPGDKLNHPVRAHIDLHGPTDAGISFGSGTWHGRRILPGQKKSYYVSDSKSLRIDIKNAPETEADKKFVQHNVNVVGGSVHLKSHPGMSGDVVAEGRGSKAQQSLVVGNENPSTLANSNTPANLNTLEISKGHMRPAAMNVHGTGTAGSVISAHAQGNPREAVNLFPLGLD